MPVDNFFCFLALYINIKRKIKEKYFFYFFVSKNKNIFSCLKNFFLF